MTTHAYAEFRWAIRRDPDCAQDDKRIERTLRVWQKLIADTHPCFFAFENELERCLVNLFDTGDSAKNAFILENLIRSSHLTLAARRKIVLE